MNLLNELGEAIRTNDDLKLRVIMTRISIEHREELNDPDFKEKLVNILKTISGGKLQ